MDNFSESAVLIGSEDGLKQSEQSLHKNDDTSTHYTSTEKQRIREAQLAAQRSGMTLSEQLAMNRQIKDDMFKEKIKPAVGLSADDYQYLNDTYEREMREAARQRQNELAEKLAFEQALREQERQFKQHADDNVKATVSIATILSAAPATVNTTDMQKKSKAQVIRVIKRRSASSSTNTDGNNNTKHQNVSSEEKEGGHDNTSSKKSKLYEESSTEMRKQSSPFPLSKSANPTTPENSLASLISYKSDDDDDDDDND